MSTTHHDLKISPKYYRDIESKLKEIIGTKVVIHNKNNNKGKIEIEYYSQDDFERIIELIKK